jgi:hypothetical protein
MYSGYYLAQIGAGTVEKDRTAYFKGHKKGYFKNYIPLNNIEFESLNVVSEFS